MNLYEDIKRILKEEINKKNTWKEVNGKLVNKYKFSNYDETVNFVNKIEKIAKKQNHHPEITFGFDTVKLTITDHEKGGVSDKCHKFTKEVNKL
jgi:4a-hydroxytetrahydrobiopterin dehydratase